MTDPTPLLQARVTPAPIQRAAMLQFLSLLPLAAGEVEALVARAVEQNPAVERPPGWTCGTCGRFCTSAGCPSCSYAPVTGERAAAVDWRDELRSQARLELPPRLYHVLDVVVGSLDDHGLLVDPPVQPAETDVATVVAAVRAVGPPGIAASSATDCVRLQVADLVRRGLAPTLLVAIVDDWLPFLADGRVVDIAAGLGVTERAVHDAVAVLTSSTRPFVVLVSSEPRARPVDVEFTLVDSQVVASVIDVNSLGLRLRDDFGDLDGEARAWLAPHREAAVRLIAALGARAGMLSRVATVLAVRQRDFLLEGSGHQPLRRTDVATDLGCHPSTVGRAVAGKVGRCPDGRVVSLASLFGSGASHREHVAAAMAASPMASDAAIAAELVRRGTPLARRTVAKYRAIVGDEVAKPASLGR